jgi:hypothetical protein
MEASKWKPLLLLVVGLLNLVQLLICDNFAKCELINDFFSEQSNLDDSNSTVPEPIDPLYDKLTQLHITETDVEDVLQLLDTTMVYRICMFCFFMDSIFPTYEFLDTCSNPWSAIFMYRYKSVRNSIISYI